MHVRLQQYFQKDIVYMHQIIKYIAMRYIHFKKITCRIARALVWSGYQLAERYPKVFRSQM